MCCFAQKYLEEDILYEIMNQEGLNIERDIMNMMFYRLWKGSERFQKLT